MRARPVVLGVAGQNLELLPERAVLWRETATLLVADPHFGKAATFRQAGVPVPRGTTTAALARLDAVVAGAAPERIVFLGDFLHAREGREEETLRVIAEWRTRRRELDLVLVRGNHDRRAGDPPAGLGIRCLDEPLIEPPFALAHHPRQRHGHFVIAGHLHPAARLFGPGGERARLPCFWFSPEVAVLPAFGDFTGTADIDPAPGDAVWIVADGAVVQVGRP